MGCRDKLRVNSDADETPAYWNCRSEGGAYHNHSVGGYIEVINNL